METTPLPILSGALVALILISGYFSGSETAMMALNRYRLRHLVRDGNRTAIMVDGLLKYPDRLLGLILFGNVLINLAAASVATIIGQRLMEQMGIAVTPFFVTVVIPFALTIIILIFSEVAPKTVAAVYPDRVAFLSVYILTPLSKVLYPLVWVVNQAANGLLFCVGVRLDRRGEDPISREELRTVVLEAGGMIPRRHQRMLLSILDLESVTVDEIMVPRGEIAGIDLNDSPSDTIETLEHCQHTRLPVFHDNIDNIVGMIHVRRILRVLIDQDEFNIEDLEPLVREPYFVPLGTPLHTQLLNFQRHKKRTGLVVDEYGVIQGLVTLEDILEEIVGEFTTDIQFFNKDIHEQEDGSYIIDGATTLRDINRQLHWHLPTGGPKTLNGLILEHLEAIPEPGTSLRIGNYTLEVTQVTGNAVRMVAIRPVPKPAAGE